MDKEKADMIIYTTEDVLRKFRLLLILIQFGCLLIRWQNCFREINQPFPDILKIYLSKVN